MMLYIKKIKLSGSNIKIEKGNILDIKYPNNYFDVIISLGVVEHFKEGPQGALDEMRRVLRKNGYLIITIPTQNFIRRLFINHIKNIFVLLNKINGCKMVFGEYRFTKNKFKKILLRNGFQIVEIAADDFKKPKSMGFYMDFPFLRAKNKKYELNGIGNKLEGILKSISPWICCAGTIFVCKLK